MRAETFMVEVDWYCLSCERVRGLESEVCEGEDGGRKLVLWRGGRLGNGSGDGGFIGHQGCEEF